MSNTEIIIAAAQRTPLGAFQGVFTPVSAPALGAAALKGALEAAGVAPADVDEVVRATIVGPPHASAIENPAPSFITA